MAAMKEKVNVYNAKGSPEEKEAEDEKDEFKRGGAKKRAAGGRADGERPMDRLDHAPRGRHAAGGQVKGNNPFSAGHRLTSPVDGSPAQRGKEGQTVPAEED